MVIELQTFEFRTADVLPQYRKGSALEDHTIVVVDGAFAMKSNHISDRSGQPTVNFSYLSNC